MKSSSTQSRERGQAIVIMAFALIALLAFAALAIDGGNAYVERRRSQNGADAGALAGARQIWINVSNLNSSETLVLKEINGAAERNGIGDSNGIPGDDINTNVRAYYTDKQGNLLSSGGAPVQVGVRGSIPSSAAGLKVYASRQFQTFIAGIVGQKNGAAEADATAIFIPPVGCGDYAIYATGPSGNNQSVHVTGSNSGGGDNFAITDGGIYGGDGGIIQNTQVNGDGLRVDLVGGCTGSCSVGGNPIVDFNAQPQSTDINTMYSLADYEPGGQYAAFAGNNYHYYGSDTTLSGNIAPGVYFINGNVTLRDIGAKGFPVNASIIALGTIDIRNTAYISTYDVRIPVLFTASGNTNSGAIGSHQPDIELHGFIYAPMGSVNVSGATGALVGAVYAKEIKWDSSKASIVYDPAYCPPKTARVWLLK